MGHHLPEINEIVTMLDHLGLRSTPQRQLVIQILREFPGHLTVDEIYRKIALTFPSVNLSTVYRILERLCELGVVIAIGDQGDERRYELVQDKPHYHAICQGCQEEQVLDQALIQQIKNQVWEQHHLKLNIGHFVGQYWCETCHPILSSNEHN